MLAQVHEWWRGCHFFRAACVVQNGHPATQFFALTSCSPTAVTNLTRESYAWRPFLLPKRIKCPDSKGFEAVEFGSSPTVRSSTLCSLTLTNSLRSSPASPCLHFVKKRKERKKTLKILKYKNRCSTSMEYEAVALKFRRSHTLDNYIEWYVIGCGSKNDTKKICV